jgi:Sulfotransferase family
VEAGKHDRLHPLRGGLRSTALYAAAARRVLARTGTGDVRRRLWSSDSRLAFVVGSPRSGTTFLAGALGGLQGFVDLTEVTPLKARIPELVELPEDEAAVQVRRILERIRRLALVHGLRGVEQTPEMAFLAGAALRAYPTGRVIHLVRDGRDVAASLLERGWLSARRSDGDDAGLAYGVEPRFWVEPERREEFVAASDATRAAWAWRRYVSAALRETAALELRYEQLVGDREAAADKLAAHLGVEPGAVLAQLASGHDRSVGRWRTALTPEQVADIEREAGPLLAQLGYA